MEDRTPHYGSYTHKLNSQYSQKKMKLRTSILTLATILLPSVASAINKQERIYAYGLATSFNDSTVYITDIQQIDDAWVDTKSGFLYSRDNYSYQLRDYLKRNGVAHPTCVTVYGKTRKDVEKKYMAIKKRYTTKGKYDIKYLNASNFSYTAIIPDESEQKTTNHADKKKNAE